MLSFAVACSFQSLSHRITIRIPLPSSHQKQPTVVPHVTWIFFPLFSCWTVVDMTIQCCPFCRDIKDLESAVNNFLVPQHVSQVLLAFKLLHLHPLMYRQTYVKINLSPCPPPTRYKDNSCHQIFTNFFRRSFANLPSTQISYFGV